MKCEMDQCKGSACVALSAARCGGDSTFMAIYTPPLPNSVVWKPKFMSPPAILSETMFRQLVRSDNLFLTSSLMLKKYEKAFSCPAEGWNALTKWLSYLRNLCPGIAIKMDQTHQPLVPVT